MEGRKLANEDKNNNKSFRNINKQGIEFPSKDYIIILILPAETIMKIWGKLFRLRWIWKDIDCCMEWAYKKCSGSERAQIFIFVRIVIKNFR